MADLPVVNAIEAQSEQDVENRETLQRSFRASLGALGTKMRAQTAVLTGIADTMNAAYNIDQQQLLVDAEERLEERRRQEEENAQADREASLVGKVKGGLLETLKKAFLGGALIGTVLLIKDNWDAITNAFEKIKPTLITIKDKIMEVADVAVPFLLDNFDIIAKTLAATWLALKVWKGLQLMAAAVAAIKTGFLAVQAATLAAGTRMGNLAATIRGSAVVSAIAAGWGALSAGLATAGTAIAGVATTVATAAWGGLVAGAVAIKAAIVAAGAALAPILVAAAPIVAIAAGVALALFGIKKAFDEARAVFAETGSVSMAITEGLSKLFATIVGFVPELLKSATAWVLGKLGFDEAAETLDNFSITDFLQNGISNIFSRMRILFMKAVNGIISIVNGLLDFIPGFGANTIDPVFNIAQEEFKIAESNRMRDERQAQELAEKNKESADTAKEAIEGTVGAGAGATGAEVNAQSAEAAAAVGNVVVTTVAPTNINAPTSTSISNQTNLPPSASRSKTMRVAGRRMYA